MPKSKPIGPVSLFLLLLTATVLADARFEVRVTPEQLDASGCFSVQVPRPGLYWQVLHTRQASTAPSLLVIGGPGDDPEPLHRVEATLLRIDGPEEPFFCLTAHDTEGLVDIVVQEASDPLEIEIDLDPLTDPLFHPLV